MQSIRVAAGDADWRKRRYFNKALLSLLLLVQEQNTGWWGVFDAVGLDVVPGLQATAPSSAEVAWGTEALKTRLAVYIFCA